MSASSLSPARLAAATVLSLTLVSCSWFTDFKRQPKIDPWETSSDTIAFRGNPQGSVPIGGSAAPGFMYSRANTPAAIISMAGIPNPVAPDSASVNRGRVQFQINCAVCHGSLGKGDGTAVKYGLFPPAIGAGSNAATALSDGYIFGIIRNGRAGMPTYNRIEESDRWDIINYLRTLQGKGTIAADTSHGRPGETGSLVPGASRMGPTVPSPYYHPMSAGAAMPDTSHKTAADSVKKTPADSAKKPEDVR